MDDDIENPASSLVASLAPSQVVNQDEVKATPEVQQDFEPKNRRKNYKWDKTDHEWLMEHCAEDVDIKTQYKKFCDFVKNKCSTCEPSFRTFEGYFKRWRVDCNQLYRLESDKVSIEAKFTKTPTGKQQKPSGPAYDKAIQAIEEHRKCLPWVDGWKPSQFSNMVNHGRNIHQFQSTMKKKEGQKGLQLREREKACNKDSTTWGYKETRKS